MFQAKYDSEATNSPPASPPLPKQVYYVVSPPHDSNDEDNKSSPHQTSPLSASPMESPDPSRHSNSSSSSSRVSGIGRKWIRKQRGWNECDVIKEEEEYDHMYFDYERCKCFIGIVGLVMIFTLFCLIIWGASRPFHPHISVKSLTVYNFYSGEGSDYSGVPTKTLTLNCSVKMNIYNPATFFGIHVCSTAVNLIFTEITVASGQLEKNYLPRKGRRIVDVNIEGQRVPLYGAGASLPTSDDNRKIPLKLDFEIVSRGYVVGKLVRTKHMRHFSCPFFVDSKNVKVVKFKDNFCTYD